MDLLCHTAHQTVTTIPISSQSVGKCGFTCSLCVFYLCVLFIVTEAMLVRLGSPGTFLPYGSFRSSSIKIGPLMSEGNIFKSLKNNNNIKDADNECQMMAKPHMMFKIFLQ